MTTLKVSTDCPESEYSAEFIKTMLDRLGVDRKVFGPAQSAIAAGADPIASLEEELGAYHTFGHRGFLVDIANFAMLAFMNSPDQPFTEPQTARDKLHRACVLHQR